MVRWALLYPDETFRIEKKTRRCSVGKRADLGIFVRSGWEANYARYLNWLITQKQIVKWEYEPVTFEFHKIKKGTRFYTPDFQVWTDSTHYEWHEVKGYMDKKSKTKLDRMARYYPGEKIVLIDKPVYRSIAKDVRGFIPEWE